MDALKIMNNERLVPNLYAKASDTTRLSIYAWPDLQDTLAMIPLGLQIKRAGWITFHTSSLERIPTGRHIYLYDATTGISQDLQYAPSYRLHLDAGEYDQRFFLVFRQQPAAIEPPPVAGTFKTFWVNGKLYALISNVPGDRCVVVITNMSGQVIARKQLNGNGNHDLVVPPISGVYVVSYYTTQGVFSEKLFLGY